MSSHSASSCHRKSNGVEDCRGVPKSAAPSRFGTPLLGIWGPPSRKIVSRGGGAQECLVSLIPVSLWESPTRESVDLTH